MWGLLAANGYRILWRVCIAALLGWLIFAGTLKPVLWPNPTTTQTGGASYTINPKTYFGCTAWNIKGVADKPAALIPAQTKGVAK